jgi:hypothetical protein
MACGATLPLPDDVARQVRNYDIGSTLEMLLSDDQ